jgi:uncharacterized protein (TIRG00374 family)
MTARTMRILTIAAKVAIVAAIVTYVLGTGRVDLTRIAAWRFAVAGAAVLLSIPLIGWSRWWVMMRSQGIEIGIYQTFRIQMIGIFFNSFLFGATGGDIIKAYYVATGPGRERKAHAIVTVFLDRVVGTLGLLPVIAAAAPFAWSSLGENRRFLVLTIVVAGIYGGVLSFFVILAIPRFRDWRRRGLEARSHGHGLGARLARFLDCTDDAIQQVVRHPVATSVCVVLSAMGHLATIAAFFLFGRALGIDSIGFGQFAILAPIALALNALPVFPAGGMGSGEFFASIVFGAAAGAEDWVGGTIMVLWRVSLLLPAPLGLVYFMRSREDVLRAEEAAAEGLEPADAGPQPRAPCRQS